MYAKLNNGKLVKPIIFKNKPEILQRLGYKEVIFAEKPVQEGYIAVCHYTETEDEIQQVWTLESITPVITLEDRVEALEEAVLELASEEEE